MYPSICLFLKPFYYFVQKSGCKNRNYFPIGQSFKHFIVDFFLRPPKLLAKADLPHQIPGEAGTKVFRLQSKSMATELFSFGFGRSHAQAITGCPL